MLNGDCRLAMLALNGVLMEARYSIFLSVQLLLICYSMALMQLAIKEAVYLLDVITLTARVAKDNLRNFIAAVFSSSDTIKLGQYFDVAIANSYCMHQLLL